MITPNLATRPFLNTRPVWLVTAAAGLAALILLALNLRLFFVANRSLDDEAARRTHTETAPAEPAARRASASSTLAGGGVPSIPTSLATLLPM